jgi:hypothetical protein
MNVGADVAMNCLSTDAYPREMRLSSYRQK